MTSGAIAELLEEVRALEAALALVTADRDRLAAELARVTAGEHLHELAKLADEKP